MIQTPINELLQIRYPILSGGMAWVSNASLASAVSNGGGLGIVAGMNSTGQQLRQEIHRLREKTNKPFGVNVMLMSPYASEVAQVVIEEKVPVVTTGAGNPAPFMNDWLRAGIKVIPVVSSVAMAILSQRMGACAVIAEGMEAGGHIGDTTTMALVPQIADHVSIPVIAAGGIADGRGVAAAFLLGAQAVQIGTRFLVAKECTIHSVYKERVLQAKDRDTIVTGARLGHPVRSLKTKFSRSFAEKEKDPAMDNKTLDAMGIGALRVAVLEGDLERGSFLCGQIAGLVKKEEEAAKIISSIFEEAEFLLGGAKKWVK